MKRAVALLAALTFCAAGSVAYALYEIYDEGKWPESWPAELEPFRERSRTLVGPTVALRHYELPFTDRAEFEAAWPHFLKVKSKGAPVILLRPDEKRFMKVDAGVVIHTPPEGTDPRKHPETPIAGVDNLGERWMRTTYIELFVDGEIVDLNRIPLPEDTPVIDRRFRDAKETASSRG